MYFLEKFSLAVMIISLAILACIFFSPEFWEIKVFDHCVLLEGEEDNESPRNVANTLNEVNKTLISIREEGIKVDVSPSVRDTVVVASAALTTATAVYTGVRLAEMVPSLVGKAAVVGGTVVTTVVTKTVLEEVGKGKMFSVKPIITKPNSYFEDQSVYEAPKSPSSSDWTVNSPNESNVLDLSSLWCNLDSTESLQKIMESLVTLSSISFTLSLYILITMILNLKDFTEVKWLKNYPKVLGYIDRVKKLRTSMMVFAVFLLLWTSAISGYASYSVLNSLLAYKSLGL